MSRFGKPYWSLLIRYIKLSFKCCRASGKHADYMPMEGWLGYSLCNHQKYNLNTRTNEEQRINICNDMIKNIFGLVETMVAKILEMREETDVRAEEEEEESKDKENVEPESSTRQSPRKVTLFCLSDDVDNDKATRNKIQNDYNQIIKKLRSINFNEQSGFLQAHPLVIVHYAVQIVRLLDNLKLKLQSDYNSNEVDSDQGASTSFFTDTLSSIKSFLINCISTNWIESI
jgi:hypothetical protein